MSNAWDQSEAELLAELTQVRLRIAEWFQDNTQAYGVDDRNAEKIRPNWLYEREAMLIGKLTLLYPATAPSRIRSVIPLDF